MHAKPTEYVVHLEVRLSGPEIDWDKLADQLARDAEDLVVYVRPRPIRPGQPPSGPFLVEGVRVDSADDS